MAKFLVIVESPKKIKVVKPYLGKDYDVAATYGHIMDLPHDKIGVNIKKEFEPTYQILPDKEQVVKNILSKAKKAQVVYLMTDLDREGTAIAYFLEMLLPPTTQTKRATTNSMTKKAVVEAIQSAGPLDMDMVQAFECRRILDRLVGYRTSFVVQQATGGRSAGRVQSAALRFLAEREKEIQSFVPKKYWDITAEFVTEDMEKIVASIKKPDKLDINTEKLAKTICKTIKAGPVKVIKYKSNKTSVKAYAPFTTSTIQQAASTYLHWSPKKTMKVAQGLYESGYITYMRTDSVFIVPDVINQMRSLIDHDYGKKYVPVKPNFFSSKKSAQEAHEAIRPTDANAHSLGGGDAAKLYQMIWKRAISSQMVPASYERSIAEFGCDDYVLDSHGSKRLFDGWQRVWTYASQGDVDLPALKVGDIVKAIQVTMEAKETQPLSRFSEASTVKRMEQLGVGRPSTFAATLETLKSRGYIELQKKTIHVTKLGVRVCNFMVDCNFCFVDLGFTASMEDKLDAISNQQDTKLSVLSEFWERLKGDIATAKEKKKEMGKTNYNCPECKKNHVESYLVLKHSKFGPFFGCEHYSDKENPCKYTAQVGDDDKPVEKKKKKTEYSDFECPKCGAKMAIRKSKYGEFLGCSSYPKCKIMMTMEGDVIKPKKKNYKKK